MYQVTCPGCGTTSRREDLLDNLACDTCRGVYPLEECEVKRVADSDYPEAAQDEVLQ